MISKRPAAAAPAAESDAKKNKRDPTTVAKGELVTFLHRVKEGRYKKRCSPEDIQEATEQLAQYTTLAQEDKAAFAMSYASNKDKKDWQWAKDFHQKVNVKKIDEENCVSKYMTRNSIELGHGS